MKILWKYSPNKCPDIPAIAPLVTFHLKVLYIEKIIYLSGASTQTPTLNISEYKVCRLLISSNSKNIKYNFFFFN